MEINLTDWIQENNLNLEFRDDGFLKLVGDERLFIELPTRDKLFDKELMFLLTEEEYSIPCQITYLS